MRLQTSKKIFAIVALTAICLPSFASAQLSILDSSVPVQDQTVVNALTGGKGGILGNLLGNSFNDALSAAETAIGKVTSTVCAGPDVLSILNAADNVTQWSYGGLALLTSNGQNAQAVAIAAKLDKLNASRLCIETQIKALKAINPVSILQAQQRQTALDELTKQDTTIAARIDILDAQYATATQSIWKTIMVKILISTTQAVAQRMVNDLTNKYKIQDFQKYADAVASQVYTNQLIRANAGSKANQLIVRSMIGNPIARNGIQSSIYNQAADALQYNGEIFDPSKLDPSDPHFYEKMAMIGAPEASAPYLKTVYAQQADATQAQALANAKSELAVSSGLKAPRNCSNAIGQQEGIDQQYIALSNQVQNRGDLLQSLKDAQALNLPVAQADIDKAQKDFDAANKQLQGLPDNYDNVALDICKEIVSPASQVDKIINTFVQGYGQGMSQYNDSNLPLFANLISNIGTKLSTNLIFGGNISPSIISETAGFGAGVSSAASYLQYLHDEQQKNGMTLQIADDGNAQDSDPFTELEVDWDATAASGVTAVNLSVNPLPFDNSGALNYPDQLKGKNISTLSGAVNFKVYKPGAYTITMKAYKGAVLFDTITTKPINYQGKSPSGSGGSQPPAAAAYTVTPPSNQSMTVGNTATLSANVTSGAGQAVSITNNISVTVDDPSIASVKSTSGKSFTIKANKVGLATMTVSWTDPASGETYNAPPFTVFVTDALTTFAPVRSPETGEVAGASVAVPLLPRGSVVVALFPRGRP